MCIWNYEISSLSWILKGEGVNPSFNYIDDMVFCNLRPGPVGIHSDIKMYMFTSLFNWQRCVFKKDGENTWWADQFNLPVLFLKTLIEATWSWFTSFIMKPCHQKHWIFETLFLLGSFNWSDWLNWLIDRVCIAFTLIIPNFYRRRTDMNVQLTSFGIDQAHAKWH